MCSNSKNKPPTLVILGPTGTGKTAALRWLCEWQAEVVSADAFQVYRGLDIGTAKPDPALRAVIPHHLLDIREPQQQYTAGDFFQDAQAALAAISGREHKAVVCGGTAFYIQSLLQGPSQAPPSDPALRAELEKRAGEQGLAAIRSELAKLDPESAERIAPADAFRTIRALEIVLLSGRPRSSFRPQQQASPHDFYVVSLERPVAELDARIRERIDTMFAQGLADEIEGLLTEGIPETAPAFKAIGYREYLEWRHQGGRLAELKERIYLNTRRYAKRQRTFIRSLPRHAILHPDDEAGIRNTVRGIWS